MRNGMWTKGLVVGIIMLFILLGSVPNIGAKTEKNIHTNITFILSKNIQNQPLGIFTRRFIQARINITIYGNCAFDYTEEGNYFFNVYIQEYSKQTPVCKIIVDPIFLPFLPRFEKTYLNFFNCNIIYLMNPKTNLTTPWDADGGYIEGNAVILIIRGY